MLIRNIKHHMMTAGIINLIALVTYSIWDNSGLSSWIQISVYAWLAIALISNFIALKHFVIGFLFTTFSVIVLWRIAWLQGLNGLATPITINVIWLTITMMYTICLQIRHHNQDIFVFTLNPNESQLLLLRLIIGFNFIPHFTEKLFAGYGPHHGDLVAFEQLHTPMPATLVWIAGLCEFGSAIGVGLGFLTRLGSACAALYILICLYAGHHNDNGFIWADPGGGWEFPFFWMLLILTIGLTGAGKFSVDGALNRKYQLPRSIQFLMGQK